MDINEESLENSLQSKNSSSSQLNLPFWIKSLKDFPDYPVDHNPNFSKLINNFSFDKEFRNKSIYDSTITTSKYNEDGDFYYLKLD